MHQVLLGLPFIYAYHLQRLEPAHGSAISAWYGRGNVSTLSSYFGFDNVLIA